MSEKTILEILKDNKDKLVSGSEIAKQLNITRSYVNKKVKELIENGYDIKTVDRSGYIYISEVRVLNATLIKEKLNKKKEVIILDEVDSTNNYLKNLAKNSTINNIIVIACKQNGGRGRLGRNFISTKNTGIYMSILIRPDISMEIAKKITCLVSVATSKAIDKITKLDTQIKWVNDLYLNGKKICGILTEGSTSIEQNIMEYLVIGIGINCYHQDFNEELIKKATTIEDEGDMIISRNELISEIANQIDYYLETIETNKFMEEYIKKSFIIGKKVELQRGNIKMNVKVIDINQNGELVVVDEQNEKQVFSSGEITRMVI